MKAIQLTGYKGFESMHLFEVEKPKPAANEVLLEVKAAGVNFAELELTKGRYRIPKEPPFIMGFEAAGVVVELGARVKNLKVGDRITSLVSTGGYAEYATADATIAIPIPEGISFNEAATIPVQGLSAYAILKLAATIGANCTYRMMLPNQTTLASGGAASLDDFVHVVHHVKSSATPSSIVSITCARNESPSLKRMVGKPYPTGLRRDCPLSAQNRCQVWRSLPTSRLLARNHFRSARQRGQVPGCNGWILLSTRILEMSRLLGGLPINDG